MPGPRILDLSHPVSDHPLNQGLVSWWMGLPHNSGSSTLFDICAVGRNHAALTNAPPWEIDPNGFGAVNYNGSSQYAQAPSSTVYDFGTGGFGVEVRFKLTSTPSDGKNFVARDSGAGGTSGYWRARVNGTPALKFEIGFSSFAGTTALTVGRWQHAVYTRDGSGNASVYLDGRSDGTGSLTSTVTGPSPVQIATFTGGGEYMPAVIGSVRLLSGLVTASEVWGLYDQSLRGYPDTLRYYTPKTYAFLGKASAGGGGGGFQPAWAARRSASILGGGMR